jgi:hypothetical protein
MAHAAQRFMACPQPFAFTVGLISVEAIAAKVLGRLDQSIGDFQPRRLTTVNGWLMQFERKRFRSAA